MKRLMDLAQGKTRMLSDKEAWGLWRPQEYYSAYTKEQQAKEQAQQRREQLRTEILQALKEDTDLARVVILAVFKQLPDEHKTGLLVLLTPQGAQDQEELVVPAGAVQITPDELPPGHVRDEVPVSRDRDDVEPQPGRRFA